MGASVEVKGLAELQAKLKALASSKATKAISREVATEAGLLVSEGFQQGMSPDGKPWAPLVVRSGQPLRDTGRLAASVTIKDTGAGFTAGTNTVYAGVHQHGAVITAKRARQLYSAKLHIGFGKSVRIPARPFLPTGELPPAWVERIKEAVEDAMGVLFPEAKQ